MIYLPKADPTVRKALAEPIISALLTQDYVSGLFVDDEVGAIGDDDVFAFAQTRGDDHIGVSVRAGLNPPLLDLVRSSTTST